MPSVTIRSKIRDIGFRIRVGARERPAFIQRKGTGCLSEISIRWLGPSRFSPFLGRASGSRGGFVDRDFRRRDGMGSAIMRCDRPEQEHGQDKRDGSFFLRREHEALASRNGGRLPHGAIFLTRCFGAVEGGVSIS